MHALRSGDYTQGNGALHSLNAQTGAHTYCCLGVATELAVDAGILSPGLQQRGSSFHYLAGPCPLGDSNTFPPQVVWDWLGLETPDPVFTIDGLPWKASELNDDLGFTFAEVADLIEAQYLVAANA